MIVQRKGEERVTDLCVKVGFVAVWWWIWGSLPSALFDIECVALGAPKDFGANGTKSLKDSPLPRKA